MIEINGLHTAVLNIEKLSIPEGKTAVLGENGSGKTAFLRILSGISVPDKTDCVLIDGAVPRRTNAGFVPEFYDDTFFFENVMDELKSPLRFSFTPLNEIESKASFTAKLCGIEDIAERETFTLSGGEKALLSLAAACIASPKILLLDSPDSHLDSESRKRLFTAASESGAKYLIYSTHEIDAASKADFVVYLQKGSVKYLGTPDEILEKIRAEFKTELKNVYSGYHDKRKNGCMESGSELILDTVHIENGDFSISAECRFCEGTHIITGKIGDGKSTLAACIADLYPENISGKIEKSGISSEIYLSQFPAYQITGRTVLNETESWNLRDDETQRLLKETGLYEKRSKNPAFLSEGEQKRLLLSCALYARSDLLILDEPFSSLDQKEKMRISTSELFDTSSPDRRHKIILIFAHEVTKLPEADFVWEICGDKNGRMLVPAVNRETGGEKI